MHFLRIGRRRLGADKGVGTISKIVLTLFPLTRQVLKRSPEPRAVHGVLRGREAAFSMVFHEKFSNRGMLPSLLAYAHAAYEPPSPSASTGIVPTLPTLSIVARIRLAWRGQRCEFFRDPQQETAERRNTDR
jgi:hypothetical protein